MYEGSGGTQGTTLRDTGLPVVIVTNIGASSGKVRKTPVMRVEHDGSYAMVASQGGAPTHPLWYYNVRANPRVELQDGPRKQDMVAREVSGQERAEWWKRAVDAYPPYAEYQQRTTREIPVFVLEPCSCSYRRVRPLRVPTPGLDRPDIHVDGSGVRADLEVEGGVGRVVLARWVDPQLERPEGRVAARCGGHCDVAVPQDGVRSSARGQYHGPDRDHVSPAGRAAELMEVTVHGGHPGEAAHRAGVPAQVGELQRVVDAPGGAVQLGHSHPDAEVVRRAGADRGRGRARRVRRQRGA